MMIVGAVSILLSVLVAWLLGSGLIGIYTTSSLVSLGWQTLVVGVAVGPINFCVGAVLPLLIAEKVAEKNEPAVATLVGRLYAIETLGGSVGAVFTGFWAIHYAGLTQTLIAVAVFSLLTGIVGLVFKLQRETDVDGNEAMSQDGSMESSKRIGSVESAENETRCGTRSMRLMVAAVFIAGCASLGLEIAWQRLLVLIVGTDSHSYTIVAVSYLAGLAFGAALSGILLRLNGNHPDRSRLLFTWVQIAAAAANLCALAVFFQLASGPGQLWLSEPFFGQAQPLFKRFVICTALLLIPTTMLGASFPVAVDAMKFSGRGLSQRTGLLYAAIALGNLAGVLLSGFLLVPAFGLQATLVGLSFVSIIAAVTNLLFFLSFKQPVAILRFELAAPLVFAVSVGAFGVYWVTNQTPVGIAWDAETSRLAMYREGPASTVAVLVDRTNPGRRQLVVDGIVVGQSGGGVEEKQQLLAHLPFLLQSNAHANSEDSEDTGAKVLTIGLGTGLLAGQSASLPHVASVVAVELSPAVIQASEYFSDLNPELPFERRVQVLQGDGIQLLRTSNQSWDAIISDGKSRPGHAGNVAFFSQDYYELAAQRLSPNGVFVQWFSLDGSNRELKVVLKSFAAQFPHGYVAMAVPDSIFLVGSSKALNPDAKKIIDYLESPHSKVLRQYYWRTADDIRGMGWLNANDVADQMSEVDINTLQHPVLEKFALDIHRQMPTASKLSNIRLLKSLVADESVNKGIPSLVGDSSLDLIQRAVMLLVDGAEKQVQRNKNWLDDAADAYRESQNLLSGLSRGGILSEFYFRSAEEFGTAGDRVGQMQSLERAARLLPADADVQAGVGARLVSIGANEQATSRFFRASRLAPENVDHHIEFAFCLLRLEKFEAAERPLTQAIKLDNRNARAYWGMGVSLEARKDQRAQQFFDTAQRLDPSLKKLMPNGRFLP